MKRLDSSKSLKALALAGVFMAGGIAHAQAPGAPGALPPGAPGMAAPGMAPGAPGMMPGATITNQQTTESITTDVPIDDSALAGEDTAALPDTGGEPLVFVGFGLMLAAGSFMLRRKLTA